MSEMDLYNNYMDGLFRNVHSQEQLEALLPPDEIKVWKGRVEKQCEQKEEDT